MVLRFKAGVYKVKTLGTDTLTYRKRADIGGFGNRLEMNPNGTEFIISPKSRDLRNLIKSYHTSDLSLYRTYQQQYAAVSTFSSDGNYLYICDNWDCILNVYKTSDMLKTKYFPVPAGDHDYLNYLLPNKNNTCLVVITMNVFTSKVKLVFLRL